MKRYLMVCIGVIGIITSYAQTSKFVQTNQQFKNGEYVWDLVYLNKRVGEFWPVKALNFITKQTNPELFKDSLNIVQKKLGAVATAPDGMTSGSVGMLMEGKALSNGIPCGDGKVYNTGIVIIENGYKISFTHLSEIKNFDSLYQSHQRLNHSLLFLPSLYRNGQYLSSSSKIEKVLVRRETPDGIQLGIVVFDKLTPYDEVRRSILGLDRRGKSKTTHMYVLDGGPTWGQCAKEVNDSIILVGTRDMSLVTNYLVLY